MGGRTGDNDDTVTNAPGLLCQSRAPIRRERWGAAPPMLPPLKIVKPKFCVPLKKNITRKKEEKLCQKAKKRVDP